MRVLWVCNIMLPEVAAAFHENASVREGWLSGAITQLKESEETELGVCVPAEREETRKAGGVTVYTFCADLSHPETYDARLEGRFDAIFKEFRPDVLHVHGTEFPHALAALRAFGTPSKSLLSIQGLCGSIATHYLDGIPEEVRAVSTFRDRVKNDSMAEQREKFFARAVHEEESIRLAGHIAGRTAFDKEETHRINPDAQYHHINETLRSVFYTGHWESAKTEAHSLFLSQGDYPLKGFHDCLVSLAKVSERYPDAKLYVAGNSLIGGGDYSGFVPLPLRISGYGKYLRQMIARYRLQRKVIMTGKLSAKQMKERFLKSNVFLCASYVENSPNALGEAMLLGVPSVATDTGGIPSLLAGGKEGLLYPPGDTDHLTESILQMFEEPVIASVYGENAKARALVTHDREENLAALLRTYHEIAT